MFIFNYDIFNYQLIVKEFTYRLRSGQTECYGMKCAFSEHERAHVYVHITYNKSGVFEYKIYDYDPNDPSWKIQRIFPMIEYKLSYPDEHIDPDNIRKCNFKLFKFLRDHMVRGNMINYMKKIYLIKHYI